MTNSSRPFSVPPPNNNLLPQQNQNQAQIQTQQNLSLSPKGLNRRFTLLLDEETENMRQKHIQLQMAAALQASLKMYGSMGQPTPGLTQDGVPIPPGGFNLRNRHYAIQANVGILIFDQHNESAPSYSIRNAAYPYPLEHQGPNGEGSGCYGLNSQIRRVQKPSFSPCGKFLACINRQGELSLYPL